MLAPQNHPHPHHPALHEHNLSDALSVQLPSSRSRLATFEGAFYYARALRVLPFHVLRATSARSSC